jgi:acetate kinase
MLDKPLSELNLITAHLGNGASITAIENGKSVDTSMGLTPLEGLVMGTRCGDLDPALIAFLERATQMSVGEIDKLLNKKSGLLGISGVSNDMRNPASRRPARATRVQSSRSRCTRIASKSTWAPIRPCSGASMRWFLPLVLVKMALMSANAYWTAWTLWATS